MQQTVLNTSDGLFAIESELQEKHPLLFSASRIGSLPAVTLNPSWIAAFRKDILYVRYLHLESASFLKHTLVVLT